MARIYNIVGLDVGGRVCHQHIFTKQDSENSSSSIYATTAKHRLCDIRQTDCYFQMCWTDIVHHVLRVSFECHTSVWNL